MLRQSPVASRLYAPEQVQSMGQFPQILRTLPNKAAPIKNVLGQALDFVKGHAAHGVTPAMAGLAGAGHAVYEGVSSGEDPMHVAWSAIRQGAIAAGGTAALGSMTGIPPAGVKFAAQAALTKMLLPPPRHKHARGGVARAVRIARKYQQGGDASSETG